ncbi:MAG: hypothetical protein R3Y64_00475 [Peptostreptococcaceae bacterium]
MLLLAGCSSQSPEQLINKKPIYNEENYILFNKIKGVIPSIEQTATLPENSSEVSKINKIDVDNNLKDEIVVFEKIQTILDDSEEETKDEIVVSLLCEDSSGYMQKVSTVVEEANYIKYANFYDLNNDNIKEMVLVLRSKDKVNMYIYEIKDGNFNKIHSLNLSHLGIDRDLQDIRVEIIDIDENNLLDMIILSQNKSNSKINLTLIEYDKDFMVKDTILVPQIKTLNGVYMKVGKISSDRKGIIIDYPTLESSSYNTDILLFEDKKIVNLFDENYSILIKHHYIESVDINDDGVLDFPVVDDENDTSSFKVDWYRYNNSIEFADMMFLNQIYYNYNYSFKFIIQNNLVNKIEITEDHGSDFALIKFHFVENFRYSELFSINISNKTNIDDVDSKTKTNIIIGENQNYTFTLLINNNEKFEELNLSIDEIRKNFSYIN